jgi:hypothetical protein
MSDFDKELSETVHVSYLLGNYPNNFTGTAETYMSKEDYIVLQHYLKKGFKVRYGDDQVADVCAKEADI